MEGDEYFRSQVHGLEFRIKEIEARFESADQREGKKGSNHPLYILGEKKAIWLIHGLEQDLEDESRLTSDSQLNRIFSGYHAHAQVQVQNNEMTQEGFANISRLAGRYDGSSIWVVYGNMAFNAKNENRWKQSNPGLSDLLTLYVHDLEGNAQKASQVCRELAEYVGRNVAEAPSLVAGYSMKILPVTNKMGIHARPAAVLVREANKYDGKVYIVKEEGGQVLENEIANGKSIMGVMILAAAKGSKLHIFYEPGKGDVNDAFNHMKDAYLHFTKDEK